MRANELIIWHEPATTPEQDELVLAIIDDGRTRACWSAIWDGRQWRDACSCAALSTRLVVAWAPMPRGPI